MLRILHPLLSLFGGLLVTALSANPHPAGVPDSTAHAHTDSVAAPMGLYIWPTDASTKITSTFAEYRSTHFHGGIDISTNGVKGYNVYAVNDGYVYKVRITPNGYGKMLFIRHYDGYVSTYAHLQGFNAEISRYVREEQYRRGTYAIDLTLPPAALPVHRGDVVAYTGDSGFGPPHLHFELRDRDLDPVNPFLITHYPITDNIPPTIRRVLIEPLTPNSTIDNESKARILSRFPRRQGNLQIPQNFLLHGSIGFGVEAQDKIDGTWSRSGIYGLQFAVDDKVIYSMNLDRVPADETKEIDLHYDFHMILQGWGKFQKLYVDSGNSLTIYHNQPEGTGVINTDALPEGMHTYAITCSDFSGNERTLTGRFTVNHSPAVTAIAPDGEGIHVRGSHLTLAARFEISGKRFASQNWSQRTVTPDDAGANDTTALLPFDGSRYDIVRVVAVTKWKSRTSPLFLFSGRPPESVRPVYCKIDVGESAVKLTVNSTGIFTAVPKVSVQEGGQVRNAELHAIDLYTYTGTFVPSASFAGTRRVHVDALVNGKPATADNAFTLYSIPTRSAGSFTTDPGNLRVTFDSGAVYTPLHMQVGSDQFRGSTVYILEPQDQLLNRGIHVTVPAPPGLDLEHRGLFFRSNSAWVLQASAPDSGAASFSTTLTRTLGELTILKDDEPPSIGRLRVGTSRRFISVSFRYRDNLSGVDPDEIKMYIDDNLVIPEIDGEHRLVTFKSSDPYEKGRHSIRISVRDRMSNEYTVSRTATVR